MSNSKRVSKDNDDVKDTNSTDKTIKKRKVGSSSSKRSDSQATRTLKACELCRKQKTKCFRSPDNPGSCLRCSFFAKRCSFEVGPPISTPTEWSLSSQGAVDLKKDLDTINKGISEILTLLKDGKEINPKDTQLLLNATGAMKSKRTVLDEVRSDDNFGFLEQNKEYIKDETQNSLLTFQSPTDSFKTSPFAIVANQLDTQFIPSSVANLLNLSVILVNNNNEFHSFNEDIISLGILSENDTIHLMDDFRRNYGRWTSFPQDISTSLLTERIRSKSPLLLTTCCCLSLRFSLNGLNPTNVDNFIIKRKQFQILIRQLLVELSKSLIKYTAFLGSTDNSGDIEFLQALVILSIYLSSLSSIVSHRDDNFVGLNDTNVDVNVVDLNLDPWHLSGIGLTTFITKSTFGSLFQIKRNIDISDPNEIIQSDLPFTFLYDELDSDEYRTLTILRIFNHLTLVHLINCIFSGRMCVLDEIRLNYCNATLSLPSSTNFDGRMVSEIGILLITYNYIQVILNSDQSIGIKECELSFINVKEEVKNWFDQWEYLFSQPALQFVELCYDFCNVLIYYNYNYQKCSLAQGSSSMKNSSTFIPLYEQDNMNYILEHCDDNSLIKILEHSNNVVKIINILESDSYFAYLSDQLHFCFYFCSLCLIKTLTYLKSNGKEYILSKAYNAKASDMGYSNTLSDDSYRDIKSLIEKYRIIAQNNPNDIISKYRMGLERLLKSLALDR